VDLTETMRAIAARADADSAWNSQVIDVMPTRPRGLAAVVDELSDLLGDWGLSGQPLK